MSSIIDWVIKGVQFIAEFINPISRVSALCAVAAGIWGYGKGLFNDLIGRLDQLSAGATGNADFTPLGFVNYVFPLDELLQHFTVLMALATVAAIIRVIKSWIPTVAS